MKSLKKATKSPIKRFLAVRSSAPSATTIQAGTPPAAASETDGDSSTASETPTEDAKKRLATLFPHGTRGLRVLVDPPNADVDIIFIHGLTGDSFRTWYHKSGTYWMASQLPQDLPRARVMTFGYDADVVKLFGAVGKGTVRDHATSLIVDLDALRRGDSADRRVIIVAHSLGGLVAKKAICVATESAEPGSSQLDRCTIGVCFLATPHRGSSLADLAATLGKTLASVGVSPNNTVLEVLRPASEIAADIHESFCLWARRNVSRTRLSCFFEEREMPGIGMVVPKASATIDGLSPIPIPSNHADMPKFAHRDEPGYRRILGQLRTYLDNQIHPSPNEGLKQTSVVGGEGLDDVATEYVKMLSFPGMYSRGSCLRRRAPNTCSWLQDHPTYREWFTRRRGIFWLLGNPGSGKSTVMRFASEASVFDQNSQAQGVVTLTFFFFAIGTHLQRTPEGFLRSLLHQLVTAVPSRLQHMVERHVLRARSMSADRKWSSVELLEALEDALAIALEHSPVRLYIDAMDECHEDGPGLPGTTDAHRLIRDLRRFHQKFGASKHPFSICFSCRHFPRLAPIHDENRVKVEDENRTDIEAFVNNEIEQELQFEPDKFSTDLAAKLLELSGGSFQWTKLAMSGALRKYTDGETPGKVLQELQLLPQELAKLYDEILEQLRDVDRPRTFWLFTGICFASKPMTLAELLGQIDVRKDSAAALEMPPWTVDSEDQLRRALPVWSGGLAELRPDELTTTDRVFLVHETVREYLFDRGLGLLVGNDLPFEVDRYRLTELCKRDKARDWPWAREGHQSEA